MTRSLLYLRAKPGQADQLLQLFERLGVLAVASEQPGFLGAELAVAVDDENQVLVTGFWASPGHYDAWLASPSRQDLLQQVEPLLASKPKTRVYRVVESVS